jgi:hypothetical protein
MKKQITQLVDDIDGKVLEAGEGETVRFGLEGRSYEIDLSASNAEKLKAALAPFMAAGRSTSGAPRTRRSASSKGNSSEMRDWLRANGYPNLGDRGRIPADAQEAYDAAH